MMKLFNVMRGGVKLLDYPSQIPWEIVAPFEGWAQANHSQSLERLNERGGLDPTELHAICHQQSWRISFKLSEEEIVAWLIETLNTFNNKNGLPEWKAD